MLKGNFNRLHFVIVILIITVFYAGNITFAQSKKQIVSEANLTKENLQLIIKQVSSTLMDTYIFEETAINMKKFIHQKFKDGKYDNIKNLELFTSQLTDDLRSISKDLHLSVFIYNRPLNSSQKPDPEQERIQALKRERKNNFGFKKIAILPGNIGLLDLRSFADTNDAGRTAVAAMNFLAYCDSLIIDLRQNGGGKPSMIQLISSYFFENPTLLGTSYIRKGNISEQQWSYAHVDGPRLIDTPIYILVSGGTFSAAEAFAYNLKHNKRAIVIGEVTRGGAHPMKTIDFPEISISIGIPYGRAINPQTGTNWEGVGVKPDILVAADIAFDTAYAEAVKKLQEKEIDPKKKIVLSMLFKKLAAKINPVTLDKKTLDTYVGDFNRLQICLEKGLLVIKYGRMSVTLNPLGNDIFSMVDREETIHFVRNSSGKVIKLKMILPNGRTIKMDRKNNQ